MIARRIPAPLYESLPGLYALVGVFLLLVGYRLASGWLSFLATVLGLVGLVAALMVWLRRRDFRRKRAEYGGQRTLDELIGEDADPPDR